jgi:hypothetical protein
MYTAMMPPNSELVEISGMCFLRSASSCIGGLIGSVLEYDSVCFTNISKTHMLGLERVQYRALRIALGLMGSTPNNCLVFLVAYHHLRKDSHT